jgi:hypothetical protein
MGGYVAGPINFYPQPTPTYAGTQVGAPLLTSATPAPAPIQNGSNGCPAYWNRFLYKTWRAANRAAGGNFSVETERIREGYYWKVLQASGHIEVSSSGLILLWFMSPESDRGNLPNQGSSVTVLTPQSPGVAISGALPQNVNGPVTLPGNEEFGLPVTPIIIPNGFFLRMSTQATAAGAQAGVVMEIRAIYLELPIDDPGPSMS